MQFILFIEQLTTKFGCLSMTLIIVPALPLMLPDLISGAIRSDSEPYLMPFLFRYSNNCCLSASYANI